MRIKITSVCGAILIIAPALFAQPQISLKDLSASYESLAGRVRPAVVQIFSTGYAAAEEGAGSNTASLLSTQRSTGSGVVLRSDGYIITNNHVVQGARKIEVRLPQLAGSRQMESLIPAKLVGTDRETDLAVIKIDRTSLPTLGLGDSNDLHQGQIVMAFGNPLGLEGSVSMGIVSSVARRIKPDAWMVYVQTDAPINPGNSGGPLVDTEGQLMGINTFIFTQSGGSEGLGFAIPSNMVRNIYDQIVKDGHVHRGQIGIVAQTITPGMAKGLHLSQDWGVIASDVTPDGPADKAGMKIGDIVQSMNGRQMTDAPQLETAIYRLKLSDLVTLTVLRDGKTLSFTMPVIERNDDPQRFADMVNPDDNLVAKLGILGIEINDEIADMLPELRHNYGVVVAAASASAPYSGGALETGDVIYEINRTPAVTIKTLRATLDDLKSGDDVVLEVERAGKLIYVTLELE